MMKSTLISDIFQYDNSTWEQSKYNIRNQLVYQKMQNFKGFQNLDKLIWASMTLRGYSEYTTPRMKTLLPLRGADHLRKIIFTTVDTDYFVENSFLHILRLIPTLGDEQRRRKPQNTKLPKCEQVIFTVYPQKFEDCEIRQDQQVRQKKVILWIY